MQAGVMRKMGRSRHAAPGRAMLLSVFVLIVWMGAAGTAWTLPLPAAFGQTIPPWLTDTPTPLPPRTLVPTSTWTPHPTWTPVPPPPPAQQPTAATPEATRPSPTAMPTLSRVPPQTSPTQPPASPTPGPPSVVFDVVVDPALAGPGDPVYFVVQVANVGYGPAQAVRVEALLSGDLTVGVVDCQRCTSAGAPGRLSIDVGRLAPGEQSLVRVSAEVAQDAWPAQNLQTLWSMTAPDLPRQSVVATLELPWAALPATGCPATLDESQFRGTALGRRQGVPW